MPDDQKTALIQSAERIASALSRIAVVLEAQYAEQKNRASPGEGATTFLDMDTPPRKDEES